MLENYESIKNAFANLEALKSDIHQTVSGLEKNNDEMSDSLDEISKELDDLLSDL